MEGNLGDRQWWEGQLLETDTGGEGQLSETDSGVWGVCFLISSLDLNV